VPQVYFLIGTFRRGNSPFPNRCLPRLSAPHEPVSVMSNNLLFGRFWLDGISGSHLN
jgi:hypothetical protein